MLWHNTEENWKSIKRGVDKSNIKFIIATGLLVYPKQPWLACNLTLIAFSICVMSFFIFISSMSLYYARNDLVTFVEIAHVYTIILTISVLVTVHYTTKMPNLHRLFQLIDEDLFVYKTLHGSEHYEKLKINIRSYTMLFQKIFHYAIFAAFVILTTLAPVLINIFGNEERKKIREINYDFPVPLWFPFNTDNKLGFFVAYLLVFAILALVCSYLAVAIPLIFYVALELIIQYRILNHSISNLDHRALERYGWKCENPDLMQIEILENDPIYERSVRDSMKENILHHIQIVKFFKLYQDITSTLFGVIIGASMAVLATMSLVLTKTKLLSPETFKFGFFFVIELFVVFGYCFMGTTLTNESSKVSDALYNSPWLNLSENQKRTLRIFQNRAKQIKIELKGNGLFVVDLQLFVQIVRTTYSIFNVFSSTEKK